MRYQFIGKKTNYYGKTAWEILGNLKNFGVGRLLRKSTTNTYNNISFVKVVKVQPLPPHRREFENRRILVWVDEVFDGRKCQPNQILSNSHMPKFQLIPRAEEEELLRQAEALKPPVKYLKKYCFCPPLYKRLWEQDNSYKQQMPKIKNITHEYKEYEVIIEDEELKPSTCSLYKERMTVDEMYKEIVRLKKIIKANQ